MNPINPAELQTYLENLEYPLDKEHLIEEIHKTGAGEEILDALERLPPMEYGSPIDVTHELDHNHDLHEGVHDHVDELDETFVDPFAEPEPLVDQHKDIPGVDTIHPGEEFAQLGDEEDHESV